MADTTQSARYFAAMLAGQDTICSRIEQDHDLYGYPPQIVCIGLKAFDEGTSVQDAVAEYLNADAAIDTARAGEKG